MAIDSFAPNAAVPASVGELEVKLYVTKGTPNTYRAQFYFPVLDAAGEVVEIREGNLTPHLTAGQLTAAKSFMDALLTKAEGVIP